MGQSAKAKPKPVRLVVNTDGFIDGVPPGIPEEAPDDVPVTIVRRRIGITEINASRLRWRTWQLLNEAASCYANNEYFACISVLQSALESWLVDQFEEIGLKRSDTFKRAIEVAKNKGIITEKEAKFFDLLRGYRNTFAHANEKSWMVPEVNEMTNPPKPLSKESLNTKGSKDLVAQMLSAELAWGHLKEVVEMMRSRYPSKEPYVYWVAQPLKHAGPQAGKDSAEEVGSQKPGA